MEWLLFRNMNWWIILLRGTESDIDLRLWTANNPTEVANYHPWLSIVYIIKNLSSLSTPVPVLCEALPQSFQILANKKWSIRSRISGWHIPHAMWPGILAVNTNGYSAVSHGLDSKDLERKKDGFENRYRIDLYITWLGRESLFSSQASLQHRKWAGYLTEARID